MKLCWRTFALLLLCALAIAACQKAESEPTRTPDQNSIAAASTLFAQPTRPPEATPTVVVSAEEIEIGLNRTAARMERAVRDGDFEAYMAYTWQDDPVFLADHTAWAQDWAAHPLEIFDIDLFNTRATTPGQAAARMSIRWRVAGRSDEGSAGGATISARFYAQDGEWLFGGADWKTADLDSIRLYYLAGDTINIEPQANVMIDYLPSIYTGVTREFEHVPNAIIHIKLYESPITLQNWTRISMPNITRWNEPGESIKIPLTPNGTAPSESTLGSELTRYLLYDMAGGTHGNFPWWLEEGIAQYGGARFSTLSQRNRILRQVAALSLAPENAEEQLFEWSLLETEPDVRDELKQVAALQAYTLVHYISETYGESARNNWIRAIATEQTVMQATPEHLGITFDELDTAWRAWLRDQL